MEFQFLEPIRKKGFKALEITVDAGKVTRFHLVMQPRKLEELIQGELELRTEIHVTLGSDLLTFGLDKILLVFKELTGRGGEQVKSTLKYDIARIIPEFSPKEERKVEKLYYKKVNAPVGRFIDALGPRVRKVRKFVKNADEFLRAEAREVAAKEIVERVKKTTSDFGFDLDRLTKRTGDLLGHLANVLGDEPAEEVKAEEYCAEVHKKAPQRGGEIKAQLFVIQRGTTLQIIGGSKMHSHFSDINPELLYDALRFYLLKKVPKKRTNKQDQKEI